ncbi:DUF547 domain-containing protein [Microvirga sp. STR05]|uniref:DUF547 domain-containing protein n=1 Tax=Hymenobacter duratus TaxID=2771356 RepID=A0ABR8JII4_9BACT|nr:DUF547 domain-containing protein [Hymenobacter duratus]MBD2716661.1 DUF547 domain-containing protein [Hymenobacter duratus]MBR7951576.1 DUF547 domain-containing protein [Microvirga sp. STR05]
MQLLLLSFRNTARLVAASSLLILSAFVSLPPIPRLPAAPVPAAPAAAGVDHSGFDKLLKKYVNEKGLVNYKAWKTDQGAFNQYLQLLSRNPPAASWSKAEQMAYWINAYNAYTIRLVLDHYPVRSIKDIGTKIQIPLVTTPWASKFFSIGGEKMSLDNIEHSIIRKRYNDPRIHFALVCAAVSCPRLRPEAYTAARLESQLDEQGRDFLNNPDKNKPGKSSAQLSRYFDWYKSDWTDNGQTVAGWVNRYAAAKMDSNAKISYLDYNWQLNQQ